MAIGAGISDGLGFGANTRIALIARGLVEMTRLGVALGARKETFMGLAGLGDLVDRKSVVEGKSVAVRVDAGGRRIIKKNKKKKRMKQDMSKMKERESIKN